MAAMRATYRSTSVDGNTEANMAALGIVGSLGFLLSISALVLGWPRTGQRRESPDRIEPVSLRLLGVLTVAGLLLGTVAGFGAVFAAAVSPRYEPTTASACSSGFSHLPPWVCWPTASLGSARVRHGASRGRSRSHSS